MLEITTNAEPTRSGQRIESILYGGRRIGRLYDNTDCEEQRTRYVVSIDGYPFGFSSPQDRALCSPDIRGECLAQVREDLSHWIAQSRSARAMIEDAFRRCLDALPEVEHTTHLDEWGEYATDTVRARALGPDGQWVSVRLTWPEAAKMIAHGYGERGNWQLIDITHGSPYNWALEWRYMRGSEWIELQSYNRATALRARRSETHQATDGR